MENSDLAIAILKGKQPEGEEINESKEALFECAQDIINAIKESDTVALKDALYGFLEVWQIHEEEESPEEEGEEHSQYDKNIKETQERNSLGGMK